MLCSTYRTLIERFYYVLLDGLYALYTYTMYNLPLFLCNVYIKWGLFGISSNLELLNDSGPRKCVFFSE